MCLPRGSGWRTGAARVGLPVLRQDFHGACRTQNAPQGAEPGLWQLGQSSVGLSVLVVTFHCPESTWLSNSQEETHAGSLASCWLGTLFNRGIGVTGWGPWSDNKVTRQWGPGSTAFQKNKATWAKTLPPLPDKVAWRGDGRIYPLGERSFTWKLFCPDTWAFITATFPQEPN